MALFGLLKKKPESIQISEELQKKQVLDIKGENVLSAPPGLIEEAKTEPKTVPKQDELGPYTEVLSNNPFMPDIPSVQDELENLKIQLKSISIQLSNIIKTVENLENKTKLE